MQVGLLGDVDDFEEEVGGSTRDTDEEETAAGGTINPIKLGKIGGNHGQDKQLEALSQNKLKWV